MRRGSLGVDNQWQYPLGCWLALEVIVREQPTGHIQHHSTTQVAVQNDGEKTPNEQQAHQKTSNPILKSAERCK